MDKVVYNEGYNDAIEAIKQTLKDAANGNTSQQKQKSRQAGQQGMESNIDVKNNDGELSKQAQDAMDQNGQGGESQMSVSPNDSGQDGHETLVEPGGQFDGNSGVGSKGSSSSRECRRGEVSELGGTFFDKETGEKLAKEEGYEGTELGRDEDVEKKWKDIGKEVAEGAASSGSGRGAGLLNILNDLYKSSKNWKGELKKYIGTAISNRDEEEATGRKAFIHQDEIRKYSKPTEDNLNKVIFMVDTSGSTHGDILLKLLSETHHIVESKKIKEVLYAYFGYNLEKVERIKDPKKIDVSKLKVADGGGTDVGRSLKDLEKYVKDQIRGGKNKVDLLMIFTDGDLHNMPANRPKWIKHVITVICDCPGCPAPAFGRTLYINTDDI